MKEFLTVDYHTVFLVKVRIHNQFEIPVSSSRLKKTKPLLFPDAALRLAVPFKSAPCSPETDTK